MCVCISLAQPRTTLLAPLDVPSLSICFMLKLHSQATEHVCVNTQGDVYIYLYIYLCIHVCTHTYIHENVHKHTHTHTHTDTYVCMYTCIYMYTCIHTHIYTYIYTNIYIRACGSSVFVYVKRQHIRACTYKYFIYMHEHICEYRHTHVYIIYKYRQTHTYIHEQTSHIGIAI